MTLQQLLYFKEVADSLHFTKAAQNLYVAQSSLSHAIISLERELGLPLFIRESGKRVRVTDYGMTLLPYVNEVCSNVDTIEQVVKEMRNPMSGVIKIAYSYINGHASVPQMLKSFYVQNAYQDISINVSVIHENQSMPDALHSGKLDLAITSSDKHSGIASAAIAKQPLFVLVPTDSAFAEYDRLTLDDIYEEPLIVYHQNSHLDHWICDMYSAHGLEPNVARYVDDWSTQMAYIAVGRGISIFPSLPVDPTLIKAIPLDDPLSQRTLYLQWNAERKLSPAIKYVKNFCIDYFKGLE